LSIANGTVDTGTVRVETPIEHVVDVVESGGKVSVRYYIIELWKKYIV